MIFIDKMKNFKIYRTKTFLPTVKGDKYKGSAILLMTPNRESSEKLMNNPMFVNSQRFKSYYLEKDVSYYINSKVVEEIEESAVEYLYETKRADLPDSAFGLPEERKFPLDTPEHVRSAIHLFGHCPENKKHQLAVRIMAAAKKFGIEVKETTQVYKYAHQKSTNESIVNESYNVSSHKLELTPGGTILDGEDIPIEQVKGKCPIPLEFFPNVMGINLCSVHSISWDRLDDNQLVNIRIEFDPELRDEVKFANESALIEWVDSEIENYRSVRSLVLNAIESGEPIDESLVINEKDIYYNKDKFDKGDINLCFIIGHSGSGKSTMAHKSEDDKTEVYELDDLVWNKMSFTMDQFKEYGDLFYSFFSGPGKKYYYTKEDVDNGSVKSVGDNYEELLINDFIKYAFSYAASHKDKKYILDGVWIVDFCKPEMFKDYAVYIKGTSLLVSRWRGAKRDSQDASKGERLKARFKNFFNFARAKDNYDFEKDLNKWRNYFKQQSTNESYQFDDPENVLENLGEYGFKPTDKEGLFEREGGDFIKIEKENNTLYATVGHKRASSKSNIKFDNANELLSYLDSMFSKDDISAVENRRTFDDPEELTYTTEGFLEAIGESVLNTGDKVMFLDESSVNDARLKRMLFRDRIRYRKDLLILLDEMKSTNPWIKYAFPELKKYMKRNVFVDLYYYNRLFFATNTWVLKKGLGLYLDFMNRLLNHPNIKKAGYNKRTIFIPVKDWDAGNDLMIWNFRKHLNPISCIYQLMFEGNIRQLKATFGDTDVLFVGDTNYFKINFSQIDAKDIKKLALKFRIFCIKICKNEEFEAEDIDSSNDIKEDPEVIQAKIVDKIEKSKGIDLTAKVAKANDKLKEEKKSGAIAVSTSNLTIQKPKTSKLTPEEDDDDEDMDTTTQDNISEEDMEKLADAIAKASDEADDEEDAMDNLDKEDIKAILLSLGDDNDVKISDARSSRITQLDKKLMEKKVNGRTVEDILNGDKRENTAETTTLNIASPNDEWSDLSYMNFDKNYDIDKDIISIFRFFSTCSRPISIRDIKVTDNSTSEDRLELYTVEMEDYRGKRWTIKLDIPIMEDNRFLLRGYDKAIQTQFFNMPIVKTDLGACQLISNYKKIFIYRFNDKNGKSIPAVSKLLKAINKYTGRKIKFTMGNNTKVCAKYNLPIDYIDLASVLSKIETDKWIVYFDQDEIRSTYEIEEGKGFPFAFNKSMNAVEYFPPEIVESFTNMLCLNLFSVDESFKELYDKMARPTVCAYSRASIMSEKIPVIVICGYHIGLRATMDRAGIKYELVDKLTREIKADVNKDWIKFEDGFVVYDVNYESSLLMNGLKTCSTDLYKLEEIDNKGMYLEFMDNYGGRYKADGLDNFRDLFVDPMIKESLEFYNLPTDYIDILLYGNAMLNDNKFIRHTDTSSRRIRRYQLIAVYTYLVLSKAYGDYCNALKHGRNSATMEVKQSAVIDMFLTDTITSDDSINNALGAIETTNQITTKGPSGLNAPRGYSLDKRTYDDSMLNVLGMTTGFAGNVGITRQTTMNANVTADGYVKSDKIADEDMNDANTLTATEGVIPFVSTHDSPMRVAMSGTQTAKHAVRTIDSDPLLVTNGSDEAIAYMTTDKFAYKAKDNGTIVELNEEYILVKYDNGKSDFISLEYKIEKNSDGGYYVPLQLKAAENLKTGSKVTKNQILAYDPLSFSNSVGESNNIAYNVGKLAKVAILCSDEGFEDSGIISEKMADALATDVIIKYDAVIDKDSTVYFLAKTGAHIEASDPLLIWEDSFDDEDTADVIAGLADSNYSDLGKRKLICETTGTLVGIKMYRTVDIEQLSPSLKKIVADYERPLKKKAKVLKDNDISISKIPSYYTLPANGKLKKSQDAVYIEIYVSYRDRVAPGDKIVYNAANKAVEKALFPKGKEPYTAFRPEEEISAFLSTSSVSKRLVTSIPTYGALQKLVIELDRHVKDIMGIEWDHTGV